jgi:hypothetical protein
MKGQRQSLRLAQKHPHRRSKRIANGRRKKTKVPRPPGGWLGRGWYEAKVVGVKRGPMAIVVGAKRGLMYLVRWTGYAGQQTWVLETHVTPLAVAAFLKKKLSEGAFAAHWKRVLFLAAQSGDIYNVRSLPDLKRFANCKDHLNNTPLHYAVANYHNIKMLKLLLDSNADINAQNNRGKTALHWAATSTRPRTVLALLRAGADVDPQDLDQETPLHKAARFNRVDAAKALIVHGADVHARDKDGDTPLADAESQGHGAMEALLRQHGGT